MDPIKCELCNNNSQNILAGHRCGYGPTGKDTGMGCGKLGTGRDPAPGSKKAKTLDEWERKADDKTFRLDVLAEEMVSCGY
jgi:hypothetical protein